MARMATVDKLESILGSRLFEAIEASRMRYQGGSISLTDCRRSHIAYREGEDFKVELWLCPSIGKAVSQTATKSIQECKHILGEYLLEAVESSNRRKKRS